MRHLFAATCLTPAALLAAPAMATTVIGTATTTPVNTSTANNGAPDDVQISSTGSVKPGAGAAVTIDSNNNVDNEGAIQITDANGSVGIFAQPGRAANITNGGTITIDETFAATDTNGDGIVDPPFASGSGRYAIHAAGALIGNIVNSGTIIVKGNDSAGIAIDGPLAGPLSSTGSITVTGDRGFGIHAASIGGDVGLSGSIGVVGQNSVGVAIDGNVGGQMTFQGSVTSTGFSTTVAGATNIADLLPDGPAVRIQGNVAGGILFAAPPSAASTTNTDVNGDGIADSGEGTASITSFGSAPGVVIGSATHAITIGALSAPGANGSGIVVNGAINGNGLDAGFDATALQIGGLGGAVTVAGGLSNAGTLSATSLDSNATALRIGAGAGLGTIANSGVIAAAGGNASGLPVQGISIDSGAQVATIVNTGSIGAKVTGTAGEAIAIADRSGTVTMIRNSGEILASVPAGSTGIAIDLSANGSGAAVIQIAPTGTNVPNIAGDVRLGSGDDLLDQEAGTFTGAASFGAGANRMILAGSAIHTGSASFGAGNDAMALSGTSQQIGDVDFGGGADSLTLNDTALLRGSLANSAGLAVAVSGGTLDLTNQGNVLLASLSVGAQGSFTVSVDGATGAHTLYQISGHASFAAGAKVNLKLASVGGSEGDFLILHAGSLSGADQLASVGGVVPFLFETNLAVDQAGGTISLDVRRKSAAELGLNRSESAAFDATFEALDSDPAVAGVFLNAQDSGSLRGALRQLLPDHAGGTFESVAEGSRAEMRGLSDPVSPLVDMGNWGLLMQQVAWGENKAMNDSDSYRLSGWGASAGPEFKLGPLGNAGLSLAYLTGSEKDGAAGNDILSNEFELAGYWRTQWKGLRAFARGSVGYVTFDSTRFFSASDGTTTVTRSAKGQWKGLAVTAFGGLSYEVRAGALSLRPSVTLDYVRLSENSFSEAGGGSAFDLAVDARKSSEEGVNATLALGYDLVRGDKVNDTYFRIELEGGRRDILSDSLGATTAHFAGGQDFTLLPDARDSGWLGRLRLTGGNRDFQVGGELGAEQQQGREAASLRAAVSVRF
jgi:hypothetical protein